MDTYLDVEGEVTTKTWVPARRKLIWWAVGRWLAIIVVVAIVITALEWLANGLSTAPLVATEISAGLLAVLLTLIFVVPLRGRLKAFNEGHMHFVARENEYVIEGPFGSETIRWSSYKKASVDSQYVYLFISNRIGQLIPLSLVPDPQPLLDHLRKLGLLRPTPKSFLLF